MHEDLAHALHDCIGRWAARNVVTATASEIEGAARSAEAAVLCRIAPAESPSSVWQEPATHGSDSIPAGSRALRGD